MAVIEFKNITKRFGSIIAVNDISFLINHGEIFFLVGPSGCGKTTILRLIAGFETPDTGELLFDGKFMNNVPPQKRNTAMVFQNYALWPHMNVKENIRYGLVERKIPKKEQEVLINNVAEMLKIENLLQRYPGELSGGQQQRVALARALVVNPAVILMDEPLSNLDANLRINMRREIRRIQRATGVTIVYVTHDQDEALSMADRIAIILEGRLIQIGTPKQIFEEPQNKFVASFIGDPNLIEGRVKEIKDDKAIFITEIGMVITKNPKNLQKAEQAILVIRPSAIRLNCSLNNSFKGKIYDINFTGDLVTIYININTVTLKALMLSNEFRRSSDIKIGKEIEFSIYEEDIQIVKS